MRNIQALYIVMGVLSLLFLVAFLETFAFKRALKAVVTAYVKGGIPSLKKDPNVLNIKTGKVLVKYTATGFEKEYYDFMNIGFVFEGEDMLLVAHSPLKHPSPKVAAFLAAHVAGSKKIFTKECAVVALISAPLMLPWQTRWVIVDIT